MMAKVVDVYFNPGTATYEEVLSDLDVEVIKTLCHNEDEIIAAASDADAVITVALRQLQPFTRRVIETLDTCRIIACIGIGYDNVDIDAATDHGICVTNVPDYCLEEVSDHTMALILALARKFPEVISKVKSGGWFITPDSRKKLSPMSRLRGQTLGLIGFGSIARTLVPKAKGFGLKILVHDPYVSSDELRGLGVEVVGLDRLLEVSDFVSLHAALTPKNSKMMGLEQFKRMKPTACLINTARGGLVDEEVLSTALLEGLIAGAGLDVLEAEPAVPDNPLYALDNVIVTGHAAGYSDQSEEEVWRRPWEEAASVLRGEWPRSLVNPRVKEKFLAKWGNMS